MFRKEWLWDEDGLTSVEYALLLALVVVVALPFWSELGQMVKRVVEEVDEAFRSVVQP